MKIHRSADYEAMSRQAALLVAGQISARPDLVLGLATGSSPVGMYRQLTEWYRDGILDFSHVHSVNLDEYVGLSPDHPQSYRRFMQDNLFNHINIPVENTNIPNGMAEDLQAECDRYDKVISGFGRIDLQILGIGLDGHIGFNEPAGALSAGTHVVDLTESTIEANSRFFEEASQVPRRALTMGVGPILQARRIVLLASGRDKAQIIADAFLGPVTLQVPASLLQLHPHVDLFGDEAALALL